MSELLNVLLLIAGPLSSLLLVWPLLFINEVILCNYNKNDSNVTDFNEWSDADLEKEKQRLLKLLKKGENNEYRANQSKNQM